MVIGVKSKICSQCNKRKKAEKFPFLNKGRGLIAAACKACAALRGERYRAKNHDKILQKQKTYYQNNKEYYLEYNKQRHISNREISLQEMKDYYQTNKEKLLAYANEYSVKNKEKIYARRNKRMKDDIVFRLRTRLGSAIWRALHKKKNNISCLKYLFFTMEELKDHLEKQFEPWMNWDNQGLYNPKTWDDNNQDTWKWQLDHIIPQSDLPYVSMADENFKKCWALKNLRPLSAKHNLLDGASRKRHKS